MARDSLRRSDPHTSGAPFTRPSKPRNTVDMDRRHRFGGGVVGNRRSVSRGQTWWLRAIPGGLNSTTKVPRFPRRYLRRGDPAPGRPRAGRVPMLRLACGSCRPDSSLLEVVLTVRSPSRGDDGHHGGKNGQGDDQWQGPPHHGSSQRTFPRRATVSARHNVQQVRRSRAIPGHRGAPPGEAQLDDRVRCDNYLERHRQVEALASLPLWRGASRGGGPKS